MLSRRPIALPQLRHSDMRLLFSPEIENSKRSNPLSLLNGFDKQGYSPPMLKIRNVPPEKYVAYSTILFFLTPFAPNSSWTLLDLIAVQDELSDLLGRKVDLVEREALRNPFRRKEILRTLELFYAA
jgi:hypothetical protein